MRKQFMLTCLCLALPLFLLLVASFAYTDASISTPLFSLLGQTAFGLVLIIGWLMWRSQMRRTREAKVLNEFSEAMRNEVAPQRLQQIALSYDVDIACILRLIATAHTTGISPANRIEIIKELEHASEQLQSGNIVRQFFSGLVVGIGVACALFCLLSTLNHISNLP